jgi:hypothetical protein
MYFLVAIMGKVVIMVANIIILELFNNFLKEKIWRCHGHFVQEFGLAKIEGSVGVFIYLFIFYYYDITVYMLI